MANAAVQRWRLSLRCATDRTGRCKKATAMAPTRTGAARQAGLGWARVGWAALGCAGLRWAALGWAGLGWRSLGPGCAGLGPGGAQPAPFTSRTFPKRRKVWCKAKLSRANVRDVAGSHLIRTARAAPHMFCRRWRVCGHEWRLPRRLDFCCETEKVRAFTRQSSGLMCICVAARYGCVHALRMRYW